MKAFHWPALMRAGLHGLRLSPDILWALTPAVLQMMLGSKAGNGPMLSEGLAALMAAYPDTIKDQYDDG